MSTDVAPNRQKPRPKRRLGAGCGELNRFRVGGLGGFAPFARGLCKRGAGALAPRFSCRKASDTLTTFLHEQIQELESLQEDVERLKLVLEGYEAHPLLTLAHAATHPQSAAGQAQLLSLRGRSG